MGLSSLGLDAFFEVVKTGTFTEAARRLHITQPALSQRIVTLESELGTRLLVRGQGRFQLTAAGEELFRYCEWRRAAEEELIGRLRGDRNTLCGSVRVCGFSSITRSVLLPCLAGLAAEHPGLRLEVFSQEIGELPEVLLSGRAQFVFSNREIERIGIVSEPVGFEELVLVEPADRPVPDIYLDHDPDDATTRQYLERNHELRKGIERMFLDDIYGIIDGVHLGLGRAVVPWHLVADDPQVRVLPGTRAQQSPVVMHTLLQPYETQLHKAVARALRTGVAERLARARFPR